MAGGPSTPELAVAATNAGGLGFVAGGYLSVDDFADRIVRARKLAAGPLGANLFVPQPSAGNRADIDRYAAALAGEAQQYGVELGEPRYTDDGWAAKLDVLLDLRPEVASFTFDVPSAEQIQRLVAAGITTVATVTTAAEAELAVSRGVDGVAVQGPAAGGHRGTYDPTARPATQPLPDLLAEVLARVQVPVVAAGGLMTAADVDGVLRGGAVAAQLGTAFLLADEAGSSPVHRTALRDPQFTETAVTRAFSGRYARGLRNRFIDEHEAQAPFGYPGDPLSDKSAARGIGTGRGSARDERVGRHGIQDGQARIGCHDHGGPVVQVGMTLPVMEPDLDAATLRAWARAIDEGPFVSACFGERIAFDNPETLTLLGALAAWTDRVRLVTTVIVPQLHDPVMLAKALATGDMLSGGRLTVGLGVGGRQDDYQAVAADPATQTMRDMAERAVAMRRVWAGERLTESVCPVGPAPVQDGGPPLLVGTMGPKTVRSAAKWADGLAGTTLDLDACAGSPTSGLMRSTRFLRAMTSISCGTWPRSWGISEIAL